MSADWPLISIVTPSYNQAAYLAQTMDSVLAQSYPNVEYLVLDAESTDGSRAILAEYAPRLSYLRIGRDAGQSAAIAEGFARAQGSILGWLNADDRLLPGALRRVAAAFRRDHRLMFAWGDARLIDVDGRPIGLQRAVPAHAWITANSGLHGWPQPAAFWRRSAYEQVGGLDVGLHFSMDRDLFLRLVHVGRARRLYGTPLAEFRMHPDSKTSRLLDVAAREHQLLVARYGRPWLARHQALLRLLWWIRYARERLWRRSLETLWPSRASVSE